MSWQAGEPVATRTHHAHSLQLFGQAQDAHERVIAARAASPMAGLTDVLVVVVMAAVEANVNELAALASGPSAGGAFDAPPAMVALAAAVNRVDEDRPREQVIRKYEAAAVALGVELRPGTATWQDGRDLMKLRDAVVHVRSTVTIGADGRPTMPAVAARLSERGLAKSAPLNSTSSWLDLIKTVEVSAWAQRSALGLMRRLTEHLSLATGHPLAPLGQRWDCTLVEPRKPAV